MDNAAGTETRRAPGYETVSERGGQAARRAPYGAYGAVPDLSVMCFHFAM